MVIEEMQSKSNNAQSFFMMAQDTGSAIKGPNRGDLFFGTGFRCRQKSWVYKIPWYVNYFPSEITSSFSRNLSSDTAPLNLSPEDKKIVGVA